jgi:hypothetical protein
MPTENGVDCEHGPVMCEIRLSLDHRLELGSGQEMVEQGGKRVALLGLGCCRSQGRVAARASKGGDKGQQNLGQHQVIFCGIPKVTIAEKFGLSEMKSTSRPAFRFPHPSMPESNQPSFRCIPLRHLRFC